MSFIIKAAIISAFFVTGASVGYAQSAAVRTNAAIWTQEDVKKLCYFRAAKDKANPKRYDICMKRHINAAGKPKPQNVISELSLADRFIASKSTTKIADPVQ